MSELEVIIISLCGALLAYIGWPALIRRMPPFCQKGALYLVIVAAVVSMADFQRHWVFLLGLGLLVGSFLAAEANDPASRLEGNLRRCGSDTDSDPGSK